jgi:glycosyltransferase involved in cell wall biosynthesis
MRILLLADINSAHTHKWIRALLKVQGHQIALFSLSKETNEYDFLDKIRFATLGLPTKKFKGANVKKLVYLRAVPQLREFVKAFAPDIMHAHYATSYGLLGGATKFHPFIISVWGTDIQSFPQKSMLHKWVISSILKKADRLLATSKSLQAELKFNFGMESNKIPFGIDIAQFPQKHVQSDKDHIVFGTVKALEDVYGIDILIRAFAEFRKRFPSVQASLFIYGKGSKEKDLKALSRELNIAEWVDFKGYVKPELIHQAYLELDVFLALSRRESFGVSVLEASASSLPVIVSKASGFREVCRNEETGYLVDIEDQEKVVQAMGAYLDPALRHKHGSAGREFVGKEFDLHQNTQELLEIYRSLCH